MLKKLIRFFNESDYLDWNSAFVADSYPRIKHMDANFVIIIKKKGIL